MNAFNDYKMCALDENQGTVRNVINALENCDGKYVIGLSAGDQLYGHHALRKWVDYVKASSKKWSFCDIVCYHKGEKRRNLCGSKISLEFETVY